jgi:hypothetical protein
MRTVKHITPTHWTWVAYDRENKMVLAAAGGTWLLQNGQYVENVDFTTDNFPQARGRAPAYEFRIQADEWILRAGAGRDEIWKRLK